MVTKINWDVNSRDTLYQKERDREKEGGTTQVLICPQGPEEPSELKTPEGEPLDGRRETYVY